MSIPICWIRKKIKDLILQYLTENIKLCGIVERSDVGVRVKEGLNIVNNVLFGEIPDKIKIQEKDVSFLVDIKKKGIKQVFT